MPCAINASVSGTDRALRVRRLARTTEQTRAASARLVHRAAEAQARTSQLLARAVLVRSASRPGSHFAHLVGEVGGFPAAAVVRRDGAVVAPEAWMAVAELATRTGPELGGRDPLLTTLDLSRSCDRLLHLRLLDAGHRHRRLTGLRAELSGEWEPFAGSDAFAFEVVTEGTVHHVRLVGELDMSVGRRVEARLIELAGSTVEVDLGELTYLDGTGLTALLTAKRQVEKAGHGFRLVGAQGVVRRVFDMIGLSGELDD